ncbi:MAG: AMP-binding protein, partial [Thermodesulfobacteriota bacterium]
MSESKIPGHIAFELDAKAENMPDTKVVTFENGKFSDEPISYSDIVVSGRKMAHAMIRAGIGKGDAFALVMRNHPEFVYAMYAAALVGSVLVPVDPRVKGKRLQYMLTDSGAKGVFFASEFMENVGDALAQMQGVKALGVAYKEGMDVAVSNDYPALNEILEGPELGPPDAVNEEVAVPFEVIYTSGTTLAGDSLQIFGDVYRD